MIGERIMRVYVVTSGTYSDYMIERVFLDKDKAEEYREWLPGGDNYVEEYDTSDDDSIQKQYKIRICLRWYPNKKEDLITKSWKDCESSYNYNDYSNYGDIWEELVIIRTVNVDNYDEQHWIDKLTKQAYDLKTQIEYLKSEGFDRRHINEVIQWK